MKSFSADKYLEDIKSRGKKSRVHRQFQLQGLQIAMHLADERHKSLYIKMAKEGDADELLVLAKRIGGNSKIKNKGAYFMRAAIEEIKRWGPKTEEKRVDTKKKKINNRKTKKIRNLKKKGKG